MDLSFPPLSLTTHRVLLNVPQARPTVCSTTIRFRAFVAIRESQPRGRFRESLGWRPRIAQPSVRNCKRLNVTPMPRNAVIALYGALGRFSRLVGVFRNFKNRRQHRNM